MSKKKPVVVRDLQKENLIRTLKFCTLWEELPTSLAVDRALEPWLDEQDFCHIKSTNTEARAMIQSECVALATLQQHYDFIVALGMNFFRTLLLRWIGPAEGIESWYQYPGRGYGQSSIYHNHRNTCLEKEVFTTRVAVPKKWKTTKIARMKGTEYEQDYIHASFGRIHTKASPGTKNFIVGCVQQDQRDLLHLALQDPNLNGWELEGAVQLAVHKGRETILRSFLSLLRQVPESSERPLLLLAAQRGQLSSTSLLLQHSLSFLTMDGAVLAAACLSCHVPVLRQLVQHYSSSSSGQARLAEDLMYEAVSTLLIDLVKLGPAAERMVVYILGEELRIDQNGFGDATEKMIQQNALVENLTALRFVADAGTIAMAKAGDLPIKPTPTLLSGHRGAGASPQGGQESRNGGPTLASCR